MSHLATDYAPLHDPTLVKMALISRAFDEWMDLAEKERSYYAYISAFDLPLDVERARELHVETEAAKARWIEATR